MATFSNQATLSYNNIVTNSNVTTGQLLAAVTATKTAVGDVYDIDGSVTYVVSIVNTGDRDLNAVTITDDLGGGNGENAPLSYIENSLRYYSNGVLQDTPDVTAGSSLVIQNVDIPAGGNGMLIYSASVTAFASPEAGGTITNTVTGQNDPQGESSLFLAEATVTVTEEPALTITKTMSPDTLTGNSELTYTFIIQNSGNRDAEVGDNVMISDTFDPVLRNITVTVDGETQTAGTDYTYNADSGEFATAAGAISVAAAVFSRDPETDIWTTTPGVTVMTVTGTVF